MNEGSNREPSHKQEGAEMKRIATAVIISMVTIGGSGIGTVFAGEQKVTLKLGGNFCDAYLGDVSEALKKVPGVKDVDLKSMKGHAVVTSEGDKTKPINSRKP